MNIRAILCARLSHSDHNHASAVAQQAENRQVALQRLRRPRSYHHINQGDGLHVYIGTRFREHYYGTIRKFDSYRETDRGVLAWAVFAPSVGPKPGLSRESMPASTHRRP